MKLKYEVPEYKRLRVIIDTDAACEADDPFAIAHALMSPKLEVKAILAEHYGRPGSMKKSYEEILTIINAMNIDVPVFEGEDGTLAETAGSVPSKAACAIEAEAMRDDPKPLYLLCQGAITNVAAAIRNNPRIIKRMTVIWIGGQDPDNQTSTHREFNAGNDVEAANEVLQSGVKLWQITAGVYKTINIGLAELQKKVYPCGKIGKHLFENMVSYNMSEGAGWTAGESWSLGDSPAVAVALDPNCGEYVYREALYINEDTTYSVKEGSPVIRLYTSVNSRYILEDFISKLQLLYGEQ